MNLPDMILDPLVAPNQLLPEDLDFGYMTQSVYFPLLPEILHLDIWSYTSPGDNVLVNVCVCVTDQISETALNFQAGGLEEDQSGAL